MTYERMLTVEEAQKTVLDSISVAGIERRGLSDTREYIPIPKPQRIRTEYTIQLVTSGDDSLNSA